MRTWIRDGLCWINPPWQLSVLQPLAWSFPHPVEWRRWSGEQRWEEWIVRYKDSLVSEGKQNRLTNQVMQRQSFTTSQPADLCADRVWAAATLEGSLLMWSVTFNCSIIGAGKNQKCAGKFGDGTKTEKGGNVMQEKKIFLDWNDGTFCNFPLHRFLYFWTVN